MDAGFLLSDDETQHIVERNPVVEQNDVINNVTIVLFAGIVISYIISVVGILIRIPSVVSVTASDVWVLASNMVSELIGIAAFAAGFVWILKGAFSPKKVGAVMMAFFVSVGIKGLAILTTGAVVTDWFAALLPVILGAVGAVAAYFYFCMQQPAKVWRWITVLVSVLGIVRALYAVATTVIYATQYVSTETALSAILYICIYVLLIYQVYVLNRKRRITNEIVHNCEDEETPA